MTDPTTDQGQDGRLWWPFAYADESIPEGRATPDAWLCRLHDGAHAYGIPSDRWYAPILLHEGASVDFLWGDPLVVAKLTIAADGSYTCVPPLPDGKYMVGPLHDGGPPGRFFWQLTGVANPQPRGIVSSDARARHTAEAAWTAWCFWAGLGPRGRA